MGCRRNVCLVFDRSRSIFLYTHWGADDLDQVLKNALIRGKGRWNDPSYLARIIFCEMVQDDVLGVTGYGLAPYEMDPEFPSIKVDLENRTVDGVEFEEFIL